MLSTLLRKLGLRAPKAEADLKALLANDYKINFERSYLQLANFDKRLAQYAGLLSRTDERISHIISGNDEMMHGKYNAIDVYMAVGRSALHLIINALIANDRDFPDTILDMPCGHGREGRFLRAAFPDAQIYGGDVNLDGIAFCKDQFGMIPVESTVDLTQLKLPAQFDIIWCGSLITHFSAVRAKQLLDKFCDHLTPGGLLLFSTHGRLHADYIHENCFKLSTDELFKQVRDEYLRTGYGYAEYPGFDQFGLSLTSPGWIANYVAARGDVTLSSYAERAWHGLHDVSVIQKSKIDQHLYP